MAKEKHMIEKYDEEIMRRDFENCVYRRCDEEDAAREAASAQPESVEKPAPTEEPPFIPLHHFVTKADSENCNFCGLTRSDATHPSSPALGKVEGMEQECR